MEQELIEEDLDDKADELEVNPLNRNEDTLDELIETGITFTGVAVEGAIESDQQDQ